MKLIFKFRELFVRDGLAYNEHEPDNIPVLNVPEQSLWFLWDKGTTPYPFQYTLKKIG